MIFDRLYRGCRHLAGYGIGLFVLAMALLNILYLSEVSYNIHEIVSLHSFWPWGLGMLALWALLLLALGHFSGLLEKTDERKLFSFLAFLYAVAAAFFIFNVDNTLRADANAVFLSTQNMKADDYSALQPGEYLARYPHQLGLALYMYLLSKFSNNAAFLFFVNFLMVLQINYCTWRISRELFEDSLTGVLTLICSFAFLPQFFFILFAYGLIPGFCFLSLGFYYALRYVKDGKTVHLAAMLCFCALAALIKQNYLIGVIAVLIFLLLSFFRERRPRLAAAMLLLVVASRLSGIAVKSGYELAGDVKLDDAAPSVLWLAMGTDIDNSRMGPGWYDGSIWDDYTAANFDAEAAAKQGWEKFSNNLEKIQAEPKRAREFFFGKILSMWCDPLYQSLWSGPMESVGQVIDKIPLRNLYSGGWLENAAEFSMKFLCLGIWLFAALFLLRNSRTHAGWEVLALYFLGGFLFHFFWEAKSQYTYTYMFSLIPLAANALAELMRSLKKRGG